MSDQVDDDHWIWLPPEELMRLQREKTRQMRAALDRLMAVGPEPTPLSKDKSGGESPSAGG
jgi:hypothetical protein